MLSEGAGIVSAIDFFLAFLVLVSCVIMMAAITVMEISMSKPLPPAIPAYRMILLFPEDSVSGESVLSLFPTVCGIILDGGS